MDTLYTKGETNLKESTIKVDSTAIIIMFDNKLAPLYIHDMNKCFEKYGIKPCIILIRGETENIYDEWNSLLCRFNCELALIINDIPTMSFNAKRTIRIWTN